MSHLGDGAFQNLSRRAGPFPIPGYSIRMPEFDLAQPFSAEYRVAGLTDIGRECGVYLAIHDSADHWLRSPTRQLRGNVRLELFDSGGRPVVQVEGELGTFIWMDRGDQPGLHGLYKMDESFFYPRSREEYVLRLSYLPDPKLIGYKGCAYLLCGGRT
jgi:hypothetical protein